MHVNPKINFENAARQSAGPQTKLRTDRKLPVSVSTKFSMLMPDLENATSTTILKSVGHDKRKHGCHGLSTS